MKVENKIVVFVMQITTPSGKATECMAGAWVLMFVVAIGTVNLAEEDGLFQH